MPSPQSFLIPIQLFTDEFMHVQQPSDCLNNDSQLIEQ